MPGIAPSTSSRRRPRDDPSSGPSDAAPSGGRIIPAEPPAAAPWTGPAGFGAARLAGALTAIAGGRLIGRTGTGYWAELAITPGRRRLRSPLFDREGVYQAAIRCSRAFGVPDPFPDVLGLAIKILDAYGPGRHQDLLLCSSASGPLARQAVLPATSFLGKHYSCLTPYLVGGRPVLFGARTAPSPVRDGGTALAEFDVAVSTGALSFDIQIAGLVGRWRTAGIVRVGQVMADDEAEELRFNPWNTGPAILPCGIADALRRPVYQSSQNRRP
jgi:hypothetical protein